MCHLYAPFVMLCKHSQIHMCLFISTGTYLATVLSPLEIFGYWNECIYGYRYQYRVSDIWVSTSAGIGD